MHRSPKTAGVVRTLTCWNAFCTFAVLVLGFTVPGGSARPVMLFWLVTTPFTAVLTLYLNRASRFDYANLTSLAVTAVWILVFAALLTPTYSL